MPSLLEAAPAAFQSVVGGLQSIIGGAKAKKAQRELEGMKSPVYKSNSSIMDFYNKALARYNVNPYDSNLYKMSQQEANRSVAQGVGALQDRRSAIAGIPALLQAKNDSMLRAGVAAEAERNQRFGQLGRATDMKADDDRMAFQYNEMMPFERKFNLLSAKAAGNNQTSQAGIGNLYGGLGNMSKLMTAAQQTK